MLCHGQTNRPDPASPEHHYSEAMDRYEAALAAHNDDADAHKGEVAAATAWALECIRQQQPERAMEILERALKVLPNDPELLLDFGIEATALKQFPIADQALHASDAARPKNPKTLYALARLETENHHLPEAEKDFRAYIALKPEDASAYFALGHICAMEQRPAEAKAAFERSVALQPNQTESYYQLGVLALDTHEDEQAASYFQKVLDRGPAHAGALTGMGQVALRAKDYPKAERLLAAAEAADPSYATPHYFRGLALAKLGRKEEAERELKLGDSRPHATAPPGAASAGGAPAPGSAPAAGAGASPPH